MRSPVELDGEAQVRDAAGAVLLHQDVLALQVSVGDGGLALRAVDLRVQVAEAAGGGVGESQQRRSVQRVHLQVVVQRAVLMVVCDEEELREGTRTFDVCSDEACRTWEERFTCWTTFHQFTFRSSPCFWFSWTQNLQISDGPVVT